MKSVIKYILEEKFRVAHEKYERMDFSEFKKAIEINAFDNPSSLYYDFLSYLLNIKESEELHSFASELMATSLCYLENAYQKAFYHANKALEYKQNYIQNLEWLLFFYSIPDKLVSKEKAIETVIRILKEDKTNKTALNFVNNYLNEDEKNQISKDLE